MLHKPAVSRLGLKVLPLFSIGIIIVVSTPSCSSQGTEISLATVDRHYQGTVYVGGEVENPGIYPFSYEDTFGAIIDVAGGLKVGSDISHVEMTVGDEPVSQKININLADSWLLEALPGIGKTTAQKIVDYRTLHGQFMTLNAILDVPGIGESTLALIKPYITVGGD